jgi:predicted amidohydrolase YtcJ
MKKIALLSIAVLLSACAADPQMSVDMVYTNGVVWTGDPEIPEIEGFAVVDGKIAPIASGNWVNRYPTIDLQGRFVMPGFIDNHVHFLEGGASLASVDLRDAKTPEEFSTRIINFAADLPKGRWVMQGNWDHENWGGEPPTKDWIDAGTGDTPVFVFRIDGHMALANSAALKLAGLDKDTLTPDGGEIVRDAGGNPTGILKDNALNLVSAVIPKITVAENLDAFKLAQDHALSLGLTQVHAVTANPNETAMIDTFRLAHKNGDMKIRAYVLTPLESWQDASALISEQGMGDEMLRWGGLKALVDGALGSATAWMYEPYTDEPDNAGFPIMNMTEVQSLIGDADAAGLKLAIHAIGDKAIDGLIDAMHETAGDEIMARRYRIEHFQHPSKDSIKRAAEYGIIASMQPYHAIDDGRWAEKKIGPERVKTTYAFKTILDAGGLLTFGSDWPVAQLSPLDGVYAAVTRRTIDDANPDGWQPQEKISVEQALTAYTAANAYAGFEEEISGTLTPGKRADFVILSADPRAIDPVKIPEIKVIETVIGGESVYRAAD